VAVVGVDRKADVDPEPTVSVASRHEAIQPGGVIGAAVVTLAPDDWRVGVATRDAIAVLTSIVTNSPARVKPQSVARHYPRP
jgi:hypothetical protein